MKEGGVAEFVLFDATNIYDLFANLSPARYVYKDGDWISSSQFEHRFGEGSLSRLVEMG
ncbi:hypothetical protein AAHB53_17725 [Niallia circulans]